MIGDDSLGLLAAPRESTAAAAAGGGGAARGGAEWRGGGVGWGRAASESSQSQARPEHSRRSGEEDTFSPHFFLAFSLLFAFPAFLYFYPPTVYSRPVSSFPSPFLRRGDVSRVVRHA